MERGPGGQAGAAVAVAAASGCRKEELRGRDIWEGPWAAGPKKKKSRGVQAWKGVFRCFLVGQASLRRTGKRAMAFITVFTGQMSSAVGPWGYSSLDGEEAEERFFWGRKGLLGLLVPCLVGCRPECLKCAWAVVAVWGFDQGASRRADRHTLSVTHFDAVDCHSDCHCKLPQRIFSTGHTCGGGWPMRSSSPAASKPVTMATFCQLGLIILLQYSPASDLPGTTLRNAHCRGASSKLMTSCSCSTPAVNYLDDHLFTIYSVLRTPSPIY